MSGGPSEMEVTMNVCSVLLDPTVKVIMLHPAPTVQQGTQQLRRAVTIVHSAQVEHLIYIKGT